MSVIGKESDKSTAGSIDQVPPPIGSDTVAEAFKHGPHGALLVAGLSVTLLFIGWLAFYFLLFMPRGSIG